MRKLFESASSGFVSVSIAPGLLYLSLATPPWCLSLLRARSVGVVSDVIRLTFQPTATSFSSKPENSLARTHRINSVSVHHPASGCRLGLTPRSRGLADTADVHRLCKRSRSHCCPTTINRSTSPLRQCTLFLPFQDLRQVCVYVSILPLASPTPGTTNSFINLALSR